MSYGKKKNKKEIKSKILSKSIKIFLLRETHIFLGSIQFPLNFLALHICEIYQLQFPSGQEAKII